MTTEITDDMIEAAGQAIRAEMRPERKNAGPLYLDHDVYEYQNYARVALEAALNPSQPSFEPGQKVWINVDEFYWINNAVGYPSRAFRGTYIQGVDTGRLKHNVKFTRDDGEEITTFWFRDSEVSPA